METTKTRQQIMKIIVIIAMFAFVPEISLSQEAAKLIYESRFMADSIDTAYTKEKMSTCEYRIKNRALSCIDKQRVKVFESFTKFYSKTNKNGKRDSRSVTLILEPISEKGIGMLNYAYKEDEIDDDNWMYFSALGKIRRMTSSDKNREEPITASFFGSEFSAEDQTNASLEEYTYKILKEETYNGRKSFVIEEIPNPRQLKRSNYSRCIYWIDQERKAINLLIEFDRQGKKVKRFTYFKWTNYSGIWIAKRTIVMNLLTKRTTVANILDHKFGVKRIDDSFLTKRTLSDFVFREQNLSRIRSQL